MIGSIIGVFAPAAVALKTKIRRYVSMSEKDKGTSQWILQYVIEVLKNVFLTTATITYILKIEDVNFNALSSYPFFTKYVVIAVVYAEILPYVEEVISKYIGISFKIEEEENAEKKES